MEVKFFKWKLNFFQKLEVNEPRLMDDSYANEKIFCIFSFF